MASLVETLAAVLVSLLRRAALVVAIGVLLLALAAVVAYVVVLRPPTEPRGIPAAPFWLALLPLVRVPDQADVFRRYLQKHMRTHGAVKLFFAGRWTIVVSRPAFLADVFKHEDGAYEKSGNYEKVPNTVMAALLGRNVISARDQDWRTSHGVVKPGLQKNFELPPLVDNSHKLVRLFWDAQVQQKRQGVCVQPFLQRYTVANAGDTLFGMGNIGTLDRDDVPLNLLQDAMKQAIFHPIFMNFPFFDQPLVPGRTRARAQCHEFRESLHDMLDNAFKSPALCSSAPGAATTPSASALPASGSAVSEQPPASSTSLGSHLIKAWRDNVLNTPDFRDNLTSTFIAGQENPQLALSSMLYLLGKHRTVQQRLRREMAAAGPAALQDATALARVPYLTAVIYESLRVCPPLSMVINRRAASDLALGGEQGPAAIIVPKGTYVGYHCIGTNHDQTVWGPDAHEFRPERWYPDGSAAEPLDNSAISEFIQQKYRGHRSRAEFASFHGGRRACLGEKFAMLELRTVLAVLVEQLTWQLDPTWVEKMTPSGPLYPRNLKLIFEKRSKV